MYQLEVHNTNTKGRSITVLTPAYTPTEPLVCPKASPGDMLHVLIRKDNEDPQELTTFIIQGPSEHEKCSSVKRTTTGGFELQVEYVRDRVMSRNKRETEWRLVLAVLYIREPSPPLTKALQVVEQYVVIDEIQNEIEDHRTLLEQARAEETRLTKELIEVRMEMVRLRKAIQRLEANLNTNVQNRIISEKIDRA